MGHHLQKHTQTRHPPPPGISLKTQQLYALVFVCRYLDLFTNFISLYAVTTAHHHTNSNTCRARYNSLMKMVFLAATFTTVWYMSAERVVKQTYDKEHDTFRILFLVIPSFFLALLIHHRFTVMEVRLVVLVMVQDLLHACRSSRCCGRFPST